MVPRKPLTAVAAIMAAAAGGELFMGRKIWGAAGEPGLWTSQADGPHTSQYLADPYSLTHVLHGVAFYGLLHLCARRLSVRARFLLCAALEAGWELLENSTFIINRYRAETVSLGYTGDSVVNSMGDILCCLSGFWLASRLPTKLSVALFFAVEGALLLTIRDDLALNVVMLIHPVAAIKAWQLGH